VFLREVRDQRNRPRRERHAAEVALLRRFSQRVWIVFFV
jgi:hypothetical protein